MKAAVSRAVPVKETFHCNTKSTQMQITVGASLSRNHCMRRLQYPPRSILKTEMPGKAVTCHFSMITCRKWSKHKLNEQHDFEQPKKTDNYITKGVRKTYEQKFAKDRLLPIEAWLNYQ